MLGQRVIAACLGQGLVGAVGAAFLDDDHEVGVVLGHVEALGCGIGDGVLVGVVAGCCGRGNSGDRVVHGVAHVHGARAVSTLGRRRRGVLVLGIEPAQRVDVVLAVLGVQRDFRVGLVTAGDLGGNQSGLAGLPCLAGHEEPALGGGNHAVHGGSALLAHGDVLRQLVGELTGGGGIERGHVRGRVLGVFGGNRSIAVGHVGRSGHSVLPRGDGVHLDGRGIRGLTLDVIERGELVTRVRVTRLGVVHRNRGRVSSGRVGGGGAERHAAQQGRRSSDAREKLPQLHEKPSLPLLCTCFLQSRRLRSLCQGTSRSANL